MPTLRVAVTQAEPVYLDLDASLNKACTLIAEAARNGAKLIAFSECWAPGYPAWIWARPVDVAMVTRYTLNALTLSPQVPSPLARIQAAAAEHAIAVVLGFAEQSPSHSLYIAQAIISPAGVLALHRRKLKPTHMERTVFGDGSGRDLTNVVPVDFGGDVGVVKVGCLACWEHAQPLLKYHTIAQGEAIHVAMWPPLAKAGAEGGLWSMSAEGCQTMSQAYAMESGAWVLHCTAVCNESGVETMKTEAGIVCNAPGGGHSCVVAPDGRRVTEPLGEGKGTEEGIVYAEVDLAQTVGVRGFIDVVGHYSRPDLLWLGVDGQQKEFVVPRRDAAGDDKDV